MYSVNAGIAIMPEQHHKKRATAAHPRLIRGGNPARSVLAPSFENPKAYFGTLLVREDTACCGKPTPDCRLSQERKRGKSA